MNQIDLKRTEAERVLEKLQQKRREQRRKKIGAFLKNAFFAVLLVVILSTISYFTYTQHDQIIGFIDTKTGVNLADIFAEKTPEAVSEDSCIHLNIEALAESQMKVTPTPKVGECYIISEDLRENWKEVVDREASRFAQFILDKSETSMDVSVITERLFESLDTGILDLRDSQVQDISSNPTQTALPAAEITNTPSPEATPSPSNTSIAQVIVVPWPEKEHGFNLEELALVMTEHNITTVSGENYTTSPQDRINWALYYPVTESEQDYVVFKMLGSPLPVACHAGNLITISLIGIDDPAAMRMTIGNEIIYFICK